VYLYFLLPLGAAAYVGSAWHSLTPWIAYVVIAVVAYFLSLDRRFFWDHKKYVDLDQVVGAILFNIFFWLHGLVYPVPSEYWLVNLVALGSFVLVAVSLRYWSDGLDPQRVLMAVSVASFAGLVLLGLAQLLEVYGYIDPKELNLSGDESSFLQRPGGFLNTNQTATIAVVFTFTCYLCTHNLLRIFQSRLGYFASIAMFAGAFVLGGTIILITQSRAGIAAFVALCLYAIGTRAVLPIAAVAIGWLIFGGADRFDYFSSELSAVSASRFGGDTSSMERAWLAEYAFHRFFDAPWLGNGYRFLVEEAGASSHSEPLEQLANYGLLGAAVVTTCVLLMYRRAGWPVWLVCIAPQLLFTHNFFETTSYQMPLAVAVFTYAYVRGLGVARERAPLRMVQPIPTTRIGAR
jgi:hypothetical protein